MNMRYLAGTDSGKVSLQTEISPEPLSGASRRRSGGCGGGADLDYG